MGRPSPKTPAQRAEENGWDIHDAFNELYSMNKILQERHDAYVMFHKEWFVEKASHSQLCGKLPTSKPGKCDCHLAAAQELHRSFPGKKS